MRIEFPANSYQQAFDQVKAQKNRLLGNLRKEICARLEHNDENERLIEALLVILYCETLDKEDVCVIEHVEYSAERFATPLRNASLAASNVGVGNQRKETRNYTVKYLRKGGDSYLVTWRRVFAGQYSYEHGRQI